MAAQAAVPQQPVSAQIVGNAFVKQYYHILHQSPGLVHRFYQDSSKLGRPEEDGSMCITTTMDAINMKILSLKYDEFTAEIKFVDSQESLNGGVTVLVIGYLTGKDNVPRNFAQSFFLAPQDKGYYVLNDMFRYMDNVSYHEETHAPTEDADAPVAPEQALEVLPEQENHTPEQETILTEESQGEVVDPPENEEVSVVEGEEPVAEVVHEVQGASPAQLIVQSNTKIEEMPKKSYASIVMDLKQSEGSFSSPPSMQRKSHSRYQEQQVKSTPPTASAIDATSHMEGVENGIHEEEADGCSIYIKGLPMSATPAMLEDEFKKFGPIKHDGIQVRSNRQQGFCFGFVEFELPDAVQKAIEASPVIIGGRSAVVEEKRSTNSKVNRGRFPVGRAPGFRDSMRGRGSYGGGRGYNRGGDFGGRGGGSRGGDYQRDNNGGSVNRGVSVYGNGRNMPSRVPATA